MKRATGQDSRYNIKYNLISIHALMKRATFAFVPYQIQNYISIHALMKRATEGETRLIVALLISIHALMKRATCQVLQPIL